MVGCGHGLIDVLGLAELQPLERSENVILLTDNMLWQLQVCVHILIIGIYHICSGVVGRDCNSDSILALPMHND